MNDRVKELRECLDLSQEAFGKQIGISRSGISNIESGIRAVSERHVKLMASAFGVNENWLRTGEGEMFTTRSDSSLDRLCDENHLSAAHRALVAAFIDLPSSVRDLFVAYVKDAAGRIERAEMAPEQPDGIIPIDDREGIRNLVYPLIDAAEAGLRDGGAGKSSS